MPSGSYITVKYLGRGMMNLDLHVSSKLRTKGIFGSYDGDPDNDVKHRVTNQGPSPSTSTQNLIDDIVKSWR